MKKMILIGVGLIVLLLAAAAGVAWYWMTGPMYRPGDVRAGRNVAEPLTPPAQGAAHANTRWVVAPGIELHHFEQGSGPEILTVHGGPGFPPTEPWAAGHVLSERYKLIYYHQRGCGLSTRPIASFTERNQYANMQLLNRTLGLPAQIADIERIRRILGQDKLVLMGHSFGAITAALYAAEFPEHVKALVFVAPANLAVLPVKGDDLFALVRRRLPAEMKDEYDRYLAEYFDFRAAFRRTEPQSSEFYGRLGKYFAAGTAIPAGSDSFGAGYVPLAAYLGMGKHHDYTAAFRGVTAPVLVIHGAGDLQSEATSRAFGQLFPNSRFVVIAGAGHFVFNDRPEEFAAAVRGFLDPLM
jgi:proline iminopeptidase